MLQWIYSKRIYFWVICILACATFISIIHFYKDWLNSPGNDLAIILMILLWLLSVFAFYFNAVSYAVYGKKCRNYGKISRGIMISFFSLIMVAGCSLAIWAMVMLTIYRKGNL
jgi:hypothetical protein